MGSHDHLRGAGMGEAWNDPEHHLDPIEVDTHMIT